MQVTDKTYVVYRHIFPNGKSYIGITCAKPYSRRWRGGTSYRNQPKMWRAICKYGWENIDHVILAKGLTKELAYTVEREMIIKFDSIANGYNISQGGEGARGVPCSPEKRLKIGRANRGRSYPHSAKNLQEYIKKHGAWNKGCHLAPEHYRKIVAERRARCNKSISAYNPITLTKVLHFDSCADAAYSMGVSKSNISRCARGGRPTSAGYVWRYDNESF